MASKFIEVKEITIESGKEYWRESYPSDAVYLVDTGMGYKMLFNVHNNMVAFMENGININFSSPALGTGSVSDDFAIRLLETAIRETKKP